MDRRQRGAPAKEESLVEIKTEQAEQRADFHFHNGGGMASSKAPHEDAVASALQHRPSGSGSEGAI